MLGFLLFVVAGVSCSFDIDDQILYKIDFPGLKKQSTGDAISPAEDLFSGSDGSEVTYTMVGRNKEKYECTIPHVKSQDGDGASEYKGLTPLGLIEKIFIGQTCAYRLESYWTYELCHGRYLRQYHEERDGKEVKVQEYFLGRFGKENLDELFKDEERDKVNDITRHPPTKKIESMSMPYFELSMEDGTLCDLNNQPRRTRVLYICYPTGRNEVYSFKETSTCEYEVVVLTATLCEHPSFKPKETSEHGISCRPANQNSPVKPVDLSLMETEGVRLRSEKMWEAHVRGGDRPGQVKIEIRPADPSSNVNPEDFDTIAVPKKESSWKETNRQPFKPMMDPTIVKEFLRGEYCLYGGSGWWKYEFCYGKKVDQYHQENNGERTVIHLGRFDEENHLRWVQDHPSKKPKDGEARKHVSHFYSDGDVCDLTGAPRHIEVKLKCKKADSPSAVTLYLLEPKPCEYVLGVESPLVCDILPHADPESGLMPPGILDQLEAKELFLDLKHELGDLTAEQEAILDMEEDKLFSKSEREQLAELKRRIGQLQKAQTGFESKSSTSTKTRTTTSQKIHQTSGEKLEASRSIRETISVENGVRTISRETIVDGLVVAIETETIDEETLQHGIPVKITTGKEQPPQLPVKIKDTQEEKEPKDEL